MATEVGSLNTSLTLDLSSFQAGIAEAARMASELGGQLRAAFNGDSGISQMAAQVREVIEAIERLRGALSSLQASQNSQSGADLFASMRTHTAALPQEIMSIQSALTAATTAAQQLSAAMGNVRSEAQQAASAAQSLTFNATGTPAMDFSAPLAQMREMAGLVQQMMTSLQAIGTVDLSTGEVQGGDQVVQIHNLLQAYQGCSAELREIIALTAQADKSTDGWLRRVMRLMSSFSGIAASIQQASNAVHGVTGGTRNANTAARNLARQTAQVSKNLQTTKGYAISVKGILGGIVIAQSFYRLVNLMQDLVAGSVAFSQNMQDASVAFGYLMKDSDVSSGAFLNALKDIALVSPLDTTDLTAASRKLMAMGFSAKSTIPALQILTDTAAVFSNGAGSMADQIDHIALAFGQMIAAGKVSSQELRQLYNAGLPVYQLLSDGLGISMEMAKNAGKYDIDSAEAVYAILLQLQNKYGGAAQALSKTMSGSLQVIRESLQQLLSYAWAPAFDQITSGLNRIAQQCQALVKITQAYGVGGLFQAIFPESSWSNLRRIASGLAQVIGALKILGQVVGSVIGGAIQMAVSVGSVVMPIIGAIAGAIARLAAYIMVAAPWVKTLLSLIALLVIAGVVAKAVTVLAKAIWLLTGAKAAAGTLIGLGKTIVKVAAVHPVLVVALMAIAAAFLAIVASSQKARAAIAAFFGGISGAASDFAQDLNMGFDPSDMLMPEFNLPDTGDFSDGLKDLVGGLEDVGDAEDEAGDKAKKAKKNIQSFDEVYQIEDEDDGAGGLGDAMKDSLDALKGMGDLDFSNMFDWTGDWAKDWGNLTAGLDSLGDGITDTFADISGVMDRFWKSLTGGGDLTDALAVFDVLSGILALLGKTKWAGALQVIEGITKIAEALKSMVTDGINFDNIMLMINGLGDVAIGLGLITGNISFVGIGLLLQGLSETFVALRDLVVDGINIAGILDVIEGLGKVAAGIGLLQKNYKLAGLGLVVTGLASVIGELAENWEAIKAGDWSGVDKVALAVGAIETLGGVLLALKAFRTAAATANTAQNAAEVAEAATAATRAAEGVEGATKSFKMPDWATIGKIFAGIAAGIAIIVGSIALIGLIDTMGLEQGKTNAKLIGQGFLELALPLGLTLAGAVGIGAVLEKTPINFKDILLGMAAIDVGLVDMVAMVALIGLIDTATVRKGTDNIRLAADAFMALEVPLDLLLVKVGIIGGIIVASSGIGALAIAAGVLTIDVAILDILGMTAAASLWDIDTMKKGATNISTAADALRSIEGPLDRLIAVAGTIGAIIVATAGLGAIAFASGLAVLDSTIATLMYWLKQYSSWDTNVLKSGAETLELAFDGFSAIEQPLSDLIGMLDNIGSHTNNLFGLFDYDYDGAFDILSRTMDSLISWMESYAGWNTEKLENGSASIQLAASAGRAIVTNLTPLMDMLDNIGQHTNNLFGLFNYDYEGAFEILSGTMDSLIAWMEKYSSWDSTKLESGSTSISLAGDAGAVIVDVLQPLMDMLDNIGKHTNNLFGLGDYDYDDAFTVLSTVMDGLISWMETYATWTTDKIVAGGEVMTAAGTAGKTVTDALQPLLDMLNGIGGHTNNLFGIGNYDYEGAFTILSNTMTSLITWIGDYAEWDVEALSAGAAVIETAVPALSTLNTTFTPLLSILDSIGQKTNNIFGIGDYDYEGALDIVISTLSTIIEALSSFGELDSKGVKGGISLLEDLNDSMASLTAVADSLTSLNSGGLPGVGEDLVDFAGEVKTAFEILGEAPYDVVNKLLDALKSLDLSGFTNIGVNTAKALTDGVNNYAPDVSTFTNAIITGMQTGISNGMATMPGWLVTNVNVPINNWFTTYMASPLYEKYGTNMMEGIKKGISNVMKVLPAWLVTNVDTPYHNWFKKYFASKNFEEYGKNIIAGMQKGLDDMAPAIWRQVREICDEIRRTIEAALSMHSPSRFTMWCGEMLMEGMQIGIADNARLAYKAANDACDQLKEAITPDAVDSVDMLGGVTQTSLTSLSDWSTQFIVTLQNTFDSVSGLFDGLTDRMNNATANLNSVPKGLNARIGTLAAADQIGSNGANAQSSTTGTHDVMQVLATLTEGSIDILSTRVAMRLYEYLAPLFADMDASEQDRTIAYIGTLIADDKGLKQLEKKLAVVRKSEASRRE